MTATSETVRVKSDTKTIIKELSTKQGLSEGEIVAQQFAKTPTKITPLTKGASREQGTIYISSATGNIYTSPLITVSKIREMLQTPYISSKLAKRSIAYFPERVEIEVTDPKQKVAPEETQILQNMCEAENVSLTDKVIQADRNALVYGCGGYNPVWGRSGGKLSLEKLRHLPSWSFDTVPTQRSSYETWSSLLPGIIIGADGNPEYWQRTSSITLETEQITNILIVKDPKDEGLAGDSKLIPLVQFIEMIKFVWNTEMQVINRVGSPIFFIRIENPRSADDPVCDGISDVTFAQMIIKDTSKDNSYVLRDNMTLQSVPFNPKKNNLDTAEALKAVIDEYFSTSDMISKDGTLIGGSSGPELQLLNQTARGVHNWLLKPFENLLNQYFPLNGYPEGWTVKLSIKLREPDKSDINIRQAEVGIAGQCVDLDDLRQKLEFEPADENKKKSIMEFWTSQVQPLANPTQFTKHTHDDEPLNSLAQELTDKLDSDIDKLSEEILKGLTA